MTIRFRCGNCRLLLKVPDDRAGLRFKCPRCGQQGAIPKPPPPKPAREPAAAPPAEEAEPIRFGSKREADEGIDMTPMVDVTFLLLIFFMVTAAYALQKSIEVPAPDQQEEAAEARTIADFEGDEDYVIIRIDKDNNVWVDDREAPSPQEVLVKLREARESPRGSTTRGPTSLLILADREARHETVVMCLDAGNAVGMENVRKACVDEQDF